MSLTGRLVTSIYVDMDSDTILERERTYRDSYVSICIPCVHTGYQPQCLVSKQMRFKHPIWHTTYRTTSASVAMHSDFVLCCASGISCHKKPRYRTRNYTFKEMVL